MLGRRPARLALVAAVAALALPACGSSNPAAPPPTTPTPPPTAVPPAPATLADLSASVTSPQTDASINCTDDVRARVTLTNRAASSVVVRGILNRTGIPLAAAAGAGISPFVP